MEHRHSYRGLLLTGSIAVAAAVASGIVVTSSDPVAAAPNPLGPLEQVTSVRLADDGSYQVTINWTQELLDDAYDLAFGVAVHDGFRAPDDDESTIPPYLRAEYTTNEASFDGQAVAADWSADGHRRSVGIGGDVPHGDHEGRLNYTVRGAALKLDEGFRVYLRSNDLGLPVIDTSALNGMVSEVNCYYRPIPEPCGEQIDDQHWRVAERAEIITIDVRGSADGLIEPVLDRK